jgi:putative sterol carrier protein
VVDLVLDWHRRNLGYVVGKKAGAPDGAVVMFDITGPTVERVALAVEGGRAAIVDDPAHVDATLRLDTEAYNALLCGRWDAADTLSSGRLHIEGDVALGRQVAGAMGYVF